MVSPGSSLPPILDLAMHASFEIASQIKNYRISIGDHLLDDYASVDDEHIFLCDQFFAQRLATGNRRIISIEANEMAKSLDRMAEIIIRLRELGVHRKTVLVAVGGGVIQDVVTFCASIYMRGIPWVYFPSTLLGMVDSCIGGKSAINVGPYKNIVGNYYPPEEVLIDLDMTQTLGVEQKVAGLCEAAKICFARDEATFNRYLDFSPTINADQALLARIIELSLQTKKCFIETDEFDQNERLLLNFGHTFGHAIEGATGFRISHGVAVGVGMLAALHYARTVYSTSQFAARAVALEQHIRALLAAVPQLSDILSATDPDSLFDRFVADKKHTATAYTIVGLTQEGALQIIRLPHGTESDATIRDIFAAVVQPAFLGNLSPARMQ